MKCFFLTGLLGILLFSLGGIVFCFLIEPRLKETPFWAQESSPLVAAGSLVLLMLALTAAYSARMIPFLYFQF